MATFQLGALTVPQTISGGVGWWFSNLVDWYAVPDSKSDITERPLGSHGAFGVARDWRSSLAVSVTLRYAGSSVGDMLAALNTAKGVVATGAQLTATFTDDLGPTSRTVSVRSVDVPDYHGLAFAEMTVHMVAPDPRRYGPLVSTSTGLPSSGTGMAFPFVFPAEFGTPGDPGRLTLTNTGTADSYPLLEVTGQLDSGFSIIDVATAREVRFERVVPAGSMVFLNARTGRAYIDQVGSDVSGFLTRTDFPVVPAGGQAVLQFASLGSSSGRPSLTARSASAWW